MRNYISVLWAFLLLNLSIVKAQVIGLGFETGSIPQSSAALEVRSTNKGILLPRVPQSNVSLINPKQEGMWFFNTTANLPYHYSGSSWKYLLNTDSWIRPSASIKRIGNKTDSIGIRLTTPTERLDVNGNILARGNLLVNNTTSTSTDLIVTGTTTSFGFLLGRQNLNISNTAGTLKLENSGVEKGFIQLSTNDLRLGTYSSNTTGNLKFGTNASNLMTLYSNGNLGIGTTAPPTSRLRVDGDIYANNGITVNTLNSSSIRSEKMFNSTTGITKNLLPICHGKIGQSGIKLGGTNNFSIDWINIVGSYDYYFEVSCPDILSTSVVIISPNIDRNYSCTYTGLEIHNGYFRVAFSTEYVDWENEEFVIENNPLPFSFVVYKNNQ